MKRERKMHQRTWKKGGRRRRRRRQEKTKPGALGDESDKLADASASPSTKQTHENEGLKLSDALFAVEPFIKVAHRTTLIII